MQLRSGGRAPSGAPQQSQEMAVPNELKVEKEKEALLIAKENDTTNRVADVDKPVKRESSYTAFLFTCCRSCVKLNTEM